tara:strand:+ start:15596 stop:15811 length:216 start_codon:yes stop_codon:yes gene_type:complete
MKFIFQNKKLIIVILVTILQIVIALQNVTPIEVNVLVWTFNLPLILIVMIPLFIGLTIGVLINHLRKRKDR